MITHARKSTLTSLIQFMLIGIVGIALIAVLTPIFAVAHQNAVHNVQSRMQELGLAMQEYADDNDGLTPSGSFCYHIGARKSLTGLGWAGQIYPYVNSPTDFQDAMGETNNSSSMGDPVAFGMNMNAARNEKDATWGDRSKTVLLFQVSCAHAKIDQPEEGDCIEAGACSPSGNGTPIVFMDGTFPRMARLATGDIGSRITGSSTIDVPAPEIDGGSFYLLADGHVKWFKPEDVSSGDDAEAPTNPQTGVITGHAAGVSNPSYKATFSTK